MRSLLIFTLVGVGAQLVDGALGMAFGVTATTLLVLSSVGAAQASAAVHLAEVGTTLASGLSHWRFKNIDWPLVAKLGVPGAVGAFLGATVLSSLSTEHAAPLMAAILMAIGVYVLLRFSLRTPIAIGGQGTRHGAKFLAPLGLFGGFIDASGGGGWGPVTTSTLLSRGKTAPRTVIGSVSASEFLVSVSASLGFLIGLVGVSLVGYSFVRLTRHLNHAGSAYGLVGGTIGPRTGFFSGFAMLGAYWGFSIGTLALTAAFVNSFIAALQPGNDNPYQVPWLVIVVIGAVISFLLSGRDIQLLAKILLAIEGIGILAMIVLVVAIFAQGGAPTTGIDFSVFSFSGGDVSGSAVLAGVDSAFAIDNHLANTEAVVLAPVTDGRWTCLQWGALTPPFGPGTGAANMVTTVGDGSDASADPMG